LIAKILRLDIACQIFPQLTAAKKSTFCGLPRLPMYDGQESEADADKPA